VIQITKLTWKNFLDIGTPMKITKTQWVKDNLPRELNGPFGEVLALLLNKNDLEKLKSAVEAYGDRRSRETK